MTRTKPRLRQEREQHGWSQEKVARELGVDRVTVSRWERGISLPYPYYREKLSALFGKDVQELGILDENDEKDAAHQLSVSPSLATQQSFVYDTAIPSSLMSANRLIGRSHLLRVLKQRLLSQERSSVTALQGLPGVGKTSLVVMLTTHPGIQAHFADGILWAGLGPNPNITELLNHWGTLLGLDTTSNDMLRDSASWTEAIRYAIGQRRLLLVIDDVWQAEEVQPLLVGGPNCAHLVTTRFPHLAAQLSEEDAIVVPELTEEDGVALLACFAPEIVESDPETASTLVRAVGCLPLALVLMGKYLRTQIYSGQPRRLRAAVEQLLNTEQRLRLSQPASSLERSASLSHDVSWSLQSTIALSCQQLNEQERQALYALSVFPAKPNSFSEEAAVAVMQMPVEMLDALNDAGLLESSGPGRYTLHQTISDYAYSAYLHVYDSLVHQRFVDYYISYVEAHQTDHRAIEREHTTILVALQTAFEHEMREELVRGVKALLIFMHDRGWYCLADLHLQRAYQAAMALDNSVDVVTTLLYLGGLAEKQGDYQQAKAYLQQGLVLARRLGQQESVCYFLSFLGWTLLEWGTYAQAEAHFHEGLTLARQMNVYESQFYSLPGLGTIALIQGHFVQAETWFQEGLTLARQINQPGSACLQLVGLGITSTYRGNYRQAERYLHEGIALARELNRNDQLSLLLAALSEVTRQRGNYAQAQVYAEEGTLLARQMGLDDRISMLLAAQALVFMDQGNYEQAEAQLQEALLLARKISHRDRVSLQLAGLGALALKRGDYQRAETYFQEGLNLTQQIIHTERTSLLLAGLGEVARQRGDYEQAEIYFQEGLLLARQINHPDRISLLLTGLGETARQRGDYEQAENWLQEGLLAARQIARPDRITLILTCLGAVALDQENYDQAQTWLQEGLLLARQIKNPERLGFVFAYLAALTCKQDNLAQAEKYCQEALAQQVGIPGLIAQTLSLQGEIQMVQQQYSHSAASFRNASKHAPQENQELRALIQFGQARLLAAQGKLLEARTHAQTSLATLEAIGNWKKQAVRQWLEMGDARA